MAKWIFHTAFHRYTDAIQRLVKLEFSEWVQIIFFVPIAIAAILVLAVFFLLLVLKWVEEWVQMRVGNDDFRL